MNLFSLEKSAALLTGSGNELGLSVGLALRKAGASVIFHGTGPRPTSLPVDCAYSQADLLLQRNAARDVVQAAWETRPELNLLVCFPSESADAQLALAAINCVTQQFATRLQNEKHGGAIVLVLNPESAAPDAASSFNRGLSALVKSLATPLSGSGIRINGVAPTNPSQDLAGTIIFLCSPAADQITGHVLRVGNG